MVNTAYISTIPGILKLAGMGVSLLAFICAIIPYGSTHYGGGWNQFSSIFTFMALTAIFIIFVMDLHGQIPSFGLLNLLAHLILLLFNFIAFIIACVLASNNHAYFHGSALIVATILFAILMAILAISAFFVFRDFHAGGSGSTTTSSKSTTVTTTTTVAA